MGTIELSGNLTVGPASSASGTFPALQASVGLSTTPSPKQMVVSTGVMSRILNAPSFATLSGVGASDTVTKGDTLYFRTNAPMELRLTFVDPDGGSDIVSVVPIYGLGFLEFPPTGTLKLLEAKGNGQIEYLVSGTG